MRTSKWVEFSCRNNEPDSKNASEEPFRQTVIGSARPLVLREANNCCTPGTLNESRLSLKVQPEALALSSKIGRAWASFARDGKPGHAGLPDWPAFTTAKRATMIFDNQCGIKNNPEGEGLGLLRQG